MGIEPGSQGSITLSDGGEAQMPLLSYRARTFAALFTISAAKARALLPGGELRPVQITPRRALILVQAMEYTDKTPTPTASSRSRSRCSETTLGTTLGSRSARLHLGSHPVADELRDLDIAPTPVLSLDIPQYTLVSNRPGAKLDVGGWRDRGVYRDRRASSGVERGARSAAEA